MGHFPFAGASDPRQGVIRLMSRLSLLASQPKLALGALLTLLLAAAAVVGSGADFTATSANPSNTFASGTLSILQLEGGDRDPHREQHAAPAPPPPSAPSTSRTPAR